MEVTTTSNQTLQFTCRETTDSTFTVRYVYEGANSEETISPDPAGTYADGQVTFTLNLTLQEETFYMFYISDSVREICRHKVYVTDQDVETYKIEAGEFVKQASDGDEFITHD